MTDVLTTHTISADPIERAAHKTRIMSLYARGAMTDTRLAEVYDRNVHMAGWPALAVGQLMGLRYELSNELVLTTCFHKGERLHALTRNLAAAS